MKLNKNSSENEFWKCSPIKKSISMNLEMDYSVILI
jgi:hypothetical protein